MEQFLGMGNGEWGMGNKLPMPYAPSGGGSNLDHPRGDGVSRPFQ
ncbi:hypothetical protein [Nostoc sp.]